jgi:hypothetical protein
VAKPWRNATDESRFPYARTVTFSSPKCSAKSVPMPSFVKRQ